MTEQVAKKNTVFYIHVLITIFFMFFFGFIPPIEPITPLGMKMLGIFIGLVYAWTTTTLLWPSFLGMIAVVTTGVTTMTDFAALSFGNETVVFMILITAFATALDRAGLVNFLSSWIISRKIVEGRPWIFTLLMLYGAFLGGMLVNTLASVIFFWKILYTVCDEFGFKKYEKYPSLMILGIVFASMTAGGTVFPFRLTGLILLGAIESVTKMSVSFFSYILFTLPLSIILVLVYYLIMRFIFRPDLSRMNKISIDFIDPKDLILSKTQKFAAFLTGVMIVLLMSVDLIQMAFPGSVVANILSGWGVIGVILVIICFAMVTRIDGKPFMNYQDAAKGIDWSMMYLFAIILPFSSLLTSDATGINTFLVQLLSPIFGGKTFLLFAFIVLLIVTLLTNVANNAVVIVIFINICTPICASMDISPIPLIMVILWCGQLAYMTPAASAPAAFVFGNSEWIKASMMYKYIAIILLIMFVVCYVIGLPLANLIF